MSIAIENPYQSPAVCPSGAAPCAGASGLWRDGHLLVASRSAVFPNICPVTAEPATDRQSTRFEFAPPWTASLDLFWPVGTILVRLFFMSTMNLEVPQSPSLTQRRWLGAGLLAGCAIIIGSFIGASFLLANTDYHRICIHGALVGLAGALLSLLYLAFAYGKLTQTRMTEEHVWIEGAHPEFLASLPAWPADQKGE